MTKAKDLARAAGWQNERETMQAWLAAARGADVFTMHAKARGRRCGEHDPEVAWEVNSGEARKFVEARVAWLEEQLRSVGVEP